MPASCCHILTWYMETFLRINYQERWLEDLKGGSQTSVGANAVFRQQKVRFTRLLEGQHLHALRRFRFFFLLLTSPSFSSDFRSLHDCYPTTGKHVWKVIGSDRWTYSEIKLSLWYYWQEVTKSKIKTDRMLLSCFCSFFFFFPSRKHKEGRKAGKQGHCLYFEFPHFGQCVLNLQPVLWM